ncbi:hypothetical protein VTO42DRAFT_2229 [Malbranchea cinnamomea]
MSSSNLINQELVEEIDAINAIYGPSTITLTSTATSSSPTITTSTTSSSDLPIQTTIVLRIPEHEHVSSFLLGFDSEYPATPPRVLGTASTSSRGEGKRWVEILSHSVASVWIPGSVCLYDAIVDAGEKLEEIRATEGKGNKEEEAPHRQQQQASCAGDDEDGSLQGGMSALNLDKDADLKAGLKNNAPQLESPPSWILSEVVTEKKSVFVARVAHVESKDQAEKYLDHLLATEKKVAAATHNITAWRIREKSTAGDVKVFQDYDDDGETAAGGRLLHLMQLMDVWNVVVVVTRWYGGVKLGPDRFRIINAVARDALVRGGFDKAAAAVAAADGQQKGKKKGKR